MSEMVCVRTFGYREIAGAAKEILESAGIHAMLMADDCGGMNNQWLVLTGGVKLFVMRENAEAAIKLMNENFPE